MSEEVNLYIKTSRESPKPGAGSYIAILEATTESGKTGTLTLKKQYDQITPHQLELNAVNDALHRFKRHVEVKIHSEHGWFETIRTRGWFEKWQKNSWFVKGKRAAGAEVLEEIWMLEHVCGITILSIDKDLLPWFLQKCSGICLFLAWKHVFSKNQAESLVRTLGKYLVEE